MASENNNSANSLTIVIPVLNEEKTVAVTVEKVLTLARQHLRTFEIIIVDDGSTDNSPEIINKLAHENQEVKALHHPVNQGAAKCFRSGLEKSSCQFIMGLPADDVLTTNSMVSLFQTIGKADLIVGCRINQKNTRTKFRYVFSMSITKFTSLIFRVKLDDYNGPIISPVHTVRKFKLRSRHFALGHEIIVKALRDWKLSSLAIDVEMNIQKKTLTSAIKLSSLLDVLITFSYLLIKKDMPVRRGALTKIRDVLGNDADTPLRNFFSSMTEAWTRRWKK